MTDLKKGHPAQTAANPVVEHAESTAVATENLADTLIKMSQHLQDSGVKLAKDAIYESKSEYYKMADGIQRMEDTAKYTFEQVSEVASAMNFPKVLKDLADKVR